MQLDVGLLELTDGGGDVAFDLVRMALGLRACSFAFATSRSSATVRAEISSLVGARASSLARGELVLELRESPHVFPMDALGDVFERADRLVACFALSQPSVRTARTARRTGRSAPPTACRTSSSARTARRPPRGSRRPARRAARMPPSRNGGKLNMRAYSARSISEVDELPAGRDLHANRPGQMVERRFDWRLRDSPAVWREALPQHSRRAS